jgi:hypothetical protein
MAKLLLYHLRINSHPDQLRCCPVPEKALGDVRLSEPVRDRLNLPGDAMLVPHRSGLQLHSALLDAVRKHPVFVRRIHPSLQGEQAIDVCLGQANDVLPFLVTLGDGAALCSSRARSEGCRALASDPTHLKQSSSGRIELTETK